MRRLLAFVSTLAFLLTILVAANGMASNSNGLFSGSQGKSPTRKSNSYSSSQNATGSGNPARQSGSSGANPWGQQNLPSGARGD